MIIKKKDLLMQNLKRSTAFKSELPENSVVKEIASILFARMDEIEELIMKLSKERDK